MDEEVAKYFHSILNPIRYVSLKYLLNKSHLSTIQSRIKAS